MRPPISILERFRRRRDQIVWVALFVIASVTGAHALPAQLEDMDGTQHALDATLASGTPVVLVFWQTWCPSCKKEAPELAAAVARYGDRLRFFGVISGPDDAIDDDEVRRTARAWGYAHPQIRDRDLRLARRFEVTGTPVIVVVSEGGRVLYRGYRLPEDWSPYLGASGDARSEMPAG